jgi:hypothetical protein
VQAAYRGALGFRGVRVAPPRERFAGLAKRESNGARWRSLEQPARTEAASAAAPHQMAALQYATHFRGADSGPRGSCSLMIEVLPDPPREIDVLRPVVAAAAPTLERFDLREFRFPERQHMRRQIELLRNFAGGVKRGARFAGASGGWCLLRPGHLRPTTSWPLPLRSPSLCLRSDAPDRDLSGPSAHVRRGRQEHDAG